jgi:hypothetical protein
MRGALNHVIPTIGGEESQGARSRRPGEGHGGLILPPRQRVHGGLGKYGPLGKELQEFGSYRIKPESRSEALM